MSEGRPTFEQAEQLRQRAEAAESDVRLLRGLLQEIWDDYGMGLALYYQRIEAALAATDPEAKA